MELLHHLFEHQPNLSSMLQIGLDILILGLLAAVLVGRRHPKATKSDGKLIESFQKIIEQTTTISQEFELNLEKRRDLIQHITVKLDQRIRDAQDRCNRLESLLAQYSDSLKTVPPPAFGQIGAKKGDSQRIAYLANKGMAAAEIAKSLKKPLGEVELILSLRKISS